MIYEYSWVHGNLASNALLDEMAELYSKHYGTWSALSPTNPGQPIRLSVSRLRAWLTPESKIALAQLGDRIVGYAIAVQAKVRDYGVISWITQLVVHEEHRRQDVGKTLLFSIWGFSSHFAWGLITANPFAVRALEKATRRRCASGRIARNRRKLMSLGAEHVPYVTAATPFAVTDTFSRINTQFYLDHSELETMLAAVTTETAPWTLGNISDGWEWLAFTFHDQTEIGLTPEEIGKMLRASDQVAKRAYSRMLLNSAHRWAQHTPEEVTWIIDYCGLAQGHSVLDLGCGNGRHVLELAARGCTATGVDYLEHLTRAAGDQARSRGLSTSTFIYADSRYLELGRKYDSGICLYDVVRSYADDPENALILESITRHLNTGRMALISDMSFEWTECKAKPLFSLADEPNRLLELQPSQTMERSGDIFNPDYYMIDRMTRIGYRKEQFAEGSELPVQLLVRDRRYFKAEIEAMCQTAGLQVLWSRFVRSGHWDVPVKPCHDRAKEILVLCRRPEST